MRQIRILAISVLWAGLYPMCLLMLALLIQLGPWEPAVRRPLALTLAFLAAALFLSCLNRVLFRRQGIAETHFRVPRAVCGQLRTMVHWLVLASLILGLPLTLLSSGTIIVNGMEYPASGLCRLLWTAAEIQVVLMVFLLTRGRSALVGAVLGGSERPGLMRRHWPLACFTLTAGLSGIVAMDVLGYRIGAAWLAGGAMKSLGTTLGLLAAYAVIARIIDSNAWHLSFRRRAVNLDGVSNETAGAARVSAREIAERLRTITKLGLTGLGVWVLSQFWQVNFAVLQSLGRFRLWDQPIDAANELYLTLGDVTVAAVVIAVMVLAWKYLPELLALAVFPRIRDDQGIRYAVLMLCRYALVLFGSLLALASVHLGVDRIGWLLAALSVGVGFGLQEIVSNFISGIILLLERPIRVGDVVRVQETVGTVDKINIRATTIINADNQSIIVPNRSFITDRLINWTHKDWIVRLVIPVGVAYGTDAARLTELLLEIAGAEPEVLAQPAATAWFLGFGNSCLNFELRVYLATPTVISAAQHRLCLAIQRRLEAEGIEMPFPQHDLHLRSVSLEAVSQLQLPDPERALTPPWSPGQAHDPHAMPGPHSRQTAG